MSGWGYGFMALNTIVFWALLVGAAVLLYRAFRGADAQRPGTPTASPAEQILAERHARGEIDDEEHRRRLKTLRRG
jgi:putative membrane protein